MKYSPAHLWATLEDEIATIGISTQLQQELEEIVYIELPKVGYRVNKGEEIAVLESTKAAIDLIAPLSGEITAVNQQLSSDPSLLKSSPEKEGWIVKLKITTPAEWDELIEADAYQVAFKG